MLFESLSLSRLTDTRRNTMEIKKKIAAKKLQQFVGCGNEISNYSYTENVFASISFNIETSLESPKHLKHWLSGHLSYILFLRWDWEGLASIPFGPI